MIPNYLSKRRDTDGKVIGKYIPVPTPPTCHLRARFPINFNKNPLELNGNLVFCEISLGTCDDFALVTSSVKKMFILFYLVSRTYMK